MIDPDQEFSPSVRPMTAHQIASEVHEYLDVPIEDVLEVLTPEICQKYMDTHINMLDNDRAAEIHDEYLGAVFEEVGELLQD